MMKTLRQVIHFLVGLTMLSSILMGGAGVEKVAATSLNVVISQVYGGGGKSGAKYNYDFIELFNLGTEAVNIKGWSVQYASATEIDEWDVTPLVGVQEPDHYLQPGQYFLVKEGSVGNELPLSDADGGIDLSANSGKVALVSNMTPLFGGQPGSTAIIDHVGYGSVDFFESSPTPQLSNNAAAIRKSGGCIETDNNAADFDIAEPTPRNSSSPFAACNNSVGSNLSIQVTPSASILFGGETVTYTIDYGVSGVDPVPDVHITDTLPSGFVYLGDNSGFTSTINGSLVDWSLGELAPGTAGSFQMMASIPTDTSLSHPTPVINTAEIGPDGIGNDPSDDIRQATGDVYQIAPIATARAGAMGDVFAVDGWVTVQPDMFQETEWVLQDGTGGISIDGLPTPDPGIALGDHVRLIGNWGQYNDQEELVDPFLSFARLGPGLELEPHTYTTAQVAAGESEGWLVQVEGVVSDLTACSNTGDYEFWLDDSSGPAHISVVINTGIDICSLGVQNGTSIRLVGFSTEDNGDFEIKPRRPADIQLKPPDNSLHIPEIQGSGDHSPYTDQAVHDVCGTVTLRKLNGADQVGFFIQEPLEDGSPETSQGIYIVSSTPVSVNENVCVNGVVSETGGLTHIIDTAVTKQGTLGSLPVTVVNLPVETSTSLERYEGMLVQIPGELTVSQNYFQGEKGQIILSAGGRLHTPTNGDGLAVSLIENLRRMIVLDDGLVNLYPDPFPYYNATTNILRQGDTVDGLTGVIDYGPVSSSLSYYLLQPLDKNAISFNHGNLRTENPIDVGGSLKVASFNLLNYFNGDGAGGGFPTSRGASTQLEFSRQRAKIIAAILSLHADVIGLVEMENDGIGPLSAIQDLVNGLNVAAGSGTYAFVAEPSPGTDAIKVSMIYNTTTVAALGAPQNFQVPDDPVYGSLYDRPPLTQTFTEISSSEIFSVIVNHFKSKGCSGASDVDLDVGQGCWNAKRVRQANQILAIVQQVQETSHDPDVLVIGDLNSYGGEDPVLALTNGGMVNEVAAWIPAEDRYSYTFDGSSGYLDQALATPNLSAQISGATFWHVNADEPRQIDYNMEKKYPDNYAPDPYRSSDHDPLLIGLDLGGVSGSLEASLVVEPGQNVAQGDIVTYTFNLTNTGQTIVPGIQVSGALPTGVAFHSWIQQNGAGYANNQVTWSGQLDPGQPLSLIYTAQVDTGFSLGGKTISHTIEYTSSPGDSGAVQADFTIRQNWKVLLPIVRVKD